jgi:hypothetical protein
MGGTVHVDPRETGRLPQQVEVELFQCGDYQRLSIDINEYI